MKASTSVGTGPAIIANNQPLGTPGVTPGVPFSGTSSPGPATAASTFEPGSPKSGQMPNVILLGHTGDGKSSAIRTLVDAGIEVFIIKTEPSEVLDDTDPEKIHWKYIANSQVPWATMLDHAQKINQLSYKLLTQVDDINKRAHDQFIRVIQTCNNFVDDRTGRAYGDVMSWGHDRALVIDSLSGLSLMAKRLMVGTKPAPDRGEWAVSMDQIELLLNQLTTGTKCLFILVAHVEREMNPTTGVSYVTVSTLGQKLAPKIPRFFSDMIHCKREGSKFEWSTLTQGYDLKTRNLPYADYLTPSFIQLVTNWRNRFEASQRVVDKREADAKALSANTLIEPKA